MSPAEISEMVQQIKRAEARNLRRNKRITSALMNINTQLGDAKTPEDITALETAHTILVASYFRRIPRLTSPEHPRSSVGEVKASRPGGVNHQTANME